MKPYEEFLLNKSQMGGEHGFKPVFMPSFLFDFQEVLVDWAVRRGRAALLEDCGLGKSPQELVWAENVVRKTNRPVLLCTPLTVGPQMMKEGEKFGIECERSRDGKYRSGARIIITNYERLHYFNPSDFSGFVGDESSIMKNFDGITKAAVTEFMRTLPYRLLCTATAAPNDYPEFGTTSEALGELGYMDMLNRFFKRDEKFCRITGMGGQGWRFRGHAQRDFWRWICSWARAIRKPSDLGFDDGKFRLPPLKMREHIVAAARSRDGWLFDQPAITLQEQREERRRTLKERCEMAAQLVADTGRPAVSWCHLNAEGDLLARLIPDSVQVSGSDPDERKEEIFTAFQSGQVRVVVTKSTIAGWGLNWQHCAHQTFFPSHSFEQWYQSIRRSWRFGQEREVTVDMIASEGERGVLANLQRKNEAADAVFARLIELMGNELKIKKNLNKGKAEAVPLWLLSHRKSQTDTPSTTAIAAR